jgi:hypothetical protein
VRDFVVEDFFLLVVFVADVKDAFFCAGQKAGENHAFDDEVGDVGEYEAVLDRARLAFVRVADDIFF